MKLSLAVAGFYNVVWGVIAVVSPSIFFRSLGMQEPNYPELWQCIGMVIGVYGVGYAIAANDPGRHWPIVLVGLLGKIFGPVGVAKAVYEGRFPLQFAWISLTNDLVWWIPFGCILALTYRNYRASKRASSPDIQTWAMRATSQYGLSILDHSKVRPVLLVFLRHLGCTFCREALADLSARRQEIEAGGTQIVLVLMGREEKAEQALKSHGLADVPRIWDPKLALYRAFGITKGSAGQLFGPKVWWRGVQAGIFGGHGIGAPEGDVTQMPGVFLVFHGEILESYRHQSAADRPDYLSLVGVAARTRRDGR